VSTVRRRALVLALTPSCLVQKSIQSEEVRGKRRDAREGRKLTEHHQQQLLRLVLSSLTDPSAYKLDRPFPFSSPAIPTLHPSYLSQLRSQLEKMKQQPRSLELSQS
jgi:hypothetical protein